MRSNLQALGVLAVAVLLNGCSTTAARKVEPSPGAGAQAFVDTQMSQTLSSIDNSLKTLLILDRGGEGPRKPGPIGTTVAGAAGPSRPASQPANGSRVAYSEVAAQEFASREVVVDRVVVDRPATPKILVAEKVVVADGILAKRVRIQWYGSVSQLLSTLSRSTGYLYEEVGKGPAPNVRIPNQEMTVREMLARAANQIEGQADIRVDTVARRIQLIRR